jgi:gliding motility-associated-like protein
MKKFALCCFALFAIFTIQAQENYWNKTQYENIKLQGTQYIFPSKFETFALDFPNIKSYLFKAEMDDFQGKIFSSQTQISLPLPDGTMEVFYVLESPVYEPGFSIIFPEIKTFLAYCPNHPEWYSRLDITPHGFHAIILGTENGSVYIDPITHLGGDVTNYLVYYKKDFQRKGESLICDFDEEHALESNGMPKSGGLKSFGTCELRTYRLAISATGEYTAFHGGTVALAAAAQVTTMNRVNGVYEREMAIHMNIIANNNLIIYTNAGTDPFTNGTTGTMINQNQTNTDAVIGNANYDIGHVFGTNSGGLAGLGVVCNNTNKARGVTGSAAPIGDPFDIDYVAHEMGHQFNGNHTQNNNCNRNNATAMEPGSASTIMGYAGICAPNVQNASDDYFHGVNLQEIGNLITNAGHTCPVKTPLANASPTVSVSSTTYNVPANTPFSLTAIASDPNANTLTYCWEQMNNNVATMPPVATATVGPNFRSFDPSTSPTRYFPELSAVIAGTTPVWEVLSSVTRTMNFRVVVRDNAPGGGCNDHEDVTVNITSTAGPFVVTNPNTTGITWTGNTNQTVTWNVANTDAAPVSCGTVNILISYNGGLTFPDTLATNVPNDGSQTVIVPNIGTTDALIIVQCANGVFYDVSNNEFTIVAVTNDYTLNATNLSASICPGDVATYALQVGVLGTFSNTVQLSAVGLPPALNASFSSNNLAPTFNSNLSISNTAAVAPGTYNFTIQATSTSGTKTLNASLVISANLSGSVSLLSPTNGATSVASPTNFSWSNIAGANYQIDISTNPSFTALVESVDGLSTNSFTSSALPGNTLFYWRISAYNTCDTIFSSTFTYTTLSCISYASSNIPIAISATGTPTINSTLTISGTTGTISDVNVINLVGTHSYINDLIFTLTSPSGTSVVLLDQICGSQNNFNINFDDAAATNTYPCPPNNGGTFIPENLLSAFNGENANGTWILSIQDVANNDGGNLQTWGLEICTQAPSCIASQDTLIVNDCDSSLVNGVWYTSSQLIVDSLLSVGACDSIIYFDITIANSSSFTQFVDACAGAPAFYNTIDTNIQVLSNSAFCDSILITYTSLFGPDTSEAFSFSCAGAPAFYNVTDTLPTLLSNTLGCDSLHLNIVTYLPPDTTNSILDTICSAPGFFGGLQIISSNTFPNQFGCDSVFRTYRYFPPSELTSDTIFSCFPADTGVVSTTFSNQFSCDSTHTRTILLINQFLSSATLSACDSAQLNGTWYFASQNVSNTFVGSNGCDSLHTVQLTINNASPITTINATTCNPSLVGTSTQNFTNAVGCDSVVVTQTTLLPSPTTVIPLSGCDSVQVNATWYFGSTIVSDTLTAANSCDSIVTYNIIVQSNAATSQNIQACDSAFVGSTWYFSSQNIVQNGTGSNGCDSVHTVILSINASQTSSSTLSACDSAQVNGTWYFASQNVSNTFVGSNGCDSLHTVQLTINNASPITTINATTCNPSLVGTSTQNFTNAVGCDSVVVTQTTLLASPTTVIPLSGCDSVQVNATWYFGSTIFSDTLTAANSCDSIVTYNIIVQSNAATSQNIQACDSAFIGGTWYFSSQNIVQNGTGSNGCDSVHTVLLSINASQTSSSTLSACDSAQVNGTWYFASQNVSNTFVGSNGCDSVHTVQLTINNASPITTINTTTCNPSLVGTSTQNFTNAVGCDSVVVMQTSLILAVSSNQIINACDSVNINGTTYTNSTAFSDTILAGSSNGCDSIINYTITIQNSVITNQTLTVCDSVQINGIVYTNSQSITQNLIAQSGCDSSHVIQLIINPSIQVNAQSSSCNFSDVGVFSSTFTAANSCDSIYTLAVSYAAYDSSYQEIITCNLNEVGSNTDTLVGSAGCDSIVVSSFIFEDFELEILNDNAPLNVGDSLLLLSNTLADSYLWSLGNIALGLEDSVYFVATTGGEFSIMLMAQLGTCVREDSVVVFVNPREIALFVPTGFSPNGDGTNDFFKVLNAAEFSNINMQVFNGWGEKVFAGNNEDPQWDGNYKNEKAPISVYSFYIEATHRTTQKVITLKGNLSLIR